MSDARERERDAGAEDDLENPGASTDTSRARPRGAARDERETQTRSGRGAI